MRSLRIDGKNIDHINGPYLLFARSHPAFSDHHEFEDWSFLADNYAGKMWGRNAIIALFNTPSEFKGAGNIPEWVEFLEVASIASDHGKVPFSPPASECTEEDLEWHPSSTNLVGVLRPRGQIDKRTFSRRLLIVSYCEDDSESFIEKHNERIKTALGASAKAVWHSEDLFGFAFLDARTPQDIVNSLHKTLRDDTVYDAAVFRLAGVLPERGTVSPLEDFLATSPR